MLDNGSPLGTLLETSSLVLPLGYTHVYIAQSAITRDVSECATHPCLMREKRSALVLRVGHQKHRPAQSASGIVVKPLCGTATCKTGFTFTPTQKSSTALHRSRVPHMCLIISGQVHNCCLVCILVHMLLLSTRDKFCRLRLLGWKV